MDTLFGLPAHPLLVHIPIVLLPLAAVGVVLMVIKPLWNQRLRWIVLALAAAGTFGAVLAASAGESLEGRIRRVDGGDAARRWHRHAELGDTARNVALLFLGLVAVYVLVPWWMERRARSGEARSSTMNRWVTIGIAVLALAGAAASFITIVYAGHTGSKSVWDNYVGDSSGG